MKPSECTNPKIGQLITHYELDQLDATDRERFEEHLLKCAHCADEVDRMYPLVMALQANRDGVRRRLAADDITAESLAGGPAPQRSPLAGRRVGPMDGWRGVLRRPAAVWGTLGTVVGVVALALIVRLVIVAPGSGTSTEYLPLLSFHPLPYSGSMTLRSEQAVAGKEDFDAGMQAYLQADFKKASRYLRRAVEKNPAQAEWWMYLGICSYLQHDPKPAVTALGRADELAQGLERIRVRWFLAQAHLLQGNRENAEPLLEWIVTQNKDYHKEAFDTLARLRELGLSGGDRTVEPFIVSPQGGDIFLAGSTIEIAWTDPLREEVKEYQLWLSSDGGISFPELLKANLQPSASHWQWNTAAHAGPRLAVRLSAVHHDGTLKKVSSRAFAVSVPPRIAVNSPRRGDRWRRGVACNVAWSNAGIWPLKYTVGLYRTTTEDTTLVEWIASSVPGTVTECAWIDTATSPSSGGFGENFRVKVTGLFTHGQVEAWSEGDFAIAPLTVVRVDTFPEPEKPRTEGDALLISWQASQPGALGYSIELCPASKVTGAPLVRQISRRSAQWLWQNIRPAGSYYVRVVAHFPEGEISGYSPVPLTIEPEVSDDRRSIASIDQAADAAPSGTSFRLDQNYPNPFNAATTIAFELLEAGPVRLSVSNSLGQRVSFLVDESLPAGQHAVQFEGQQLPSGVYLYSLEMGGAVVHRKMLLVK